MKDRYHKKANVLGIDVSVMRVDKAVNVSMELMRGKGLPVIYFLSAISSLLCQNNEQSAEYVKSCNLILAGDRILRWQYITDRIMDRYQKELENLLIII